MDATLWLFAGLVWLLCAIVCGFLAPGKGRSSFEWFFVGLFLGIFGVAFLAMAEPVKPGERRICVHCGKPVDPSRERLCDNCGLPFAA